VTLKPPVVDAGVPEIVEGQHLNPGFPARGPERFLDVCERAPVHREAPPVNGPGHHFRPIANVAISVCSRQFWASA